MSFKRSASEKRIRNTARTIQEAHELTNAKAAATYHSGVPAAKLEPSDTGTWVGQPPRLAAEAGYYHCESKREGFAPTTSMRIQAAIDDYLVAMALNGYVLTKMRSGK